MNEIVVVEGTKLQRVEYQGKPIITLPMVDRAHKRPAGTAKRTFQKFKNRLTEGEDFHEVPYEEWSSLVGRNTYHQNGQKGGHRGMMIFLTLTGYLMLVKPLQDDVSWAVQRALVNHYFSAEKLIAGLTGQLRFLQEKYIESLEENRAVRISLMDAIERTPAKPATDRDRLQIIDMKRQGKATAQIVEKTGWSSSTVCKIVRKARAAGELPPLPWSEKLKLLHLHPEYLKEVR